MFSIEIKCAKLELWAKMHWRDMLQSNFSHLPLRASCPQALHSEPAWSAAVMKNRQLLLLAFIATNPKARHNKSLKEVFISAGEVATGWRESRSRQKSREREQEEKKKRAEASL